MFGLLYKEWLANKKQFIPIWIVTAFFSALMVIAPLASDLEGWEVNLILCFASLVIMLVFEMFQQGIFEHDERKVWQAFICSTSHGIRNQVVSKYIFQLLLSLAIFSWCSIIFLTAKCIENNCEIGIAFRVLQTLLWIQICFRAFENPFLIRFGSKKGNIIRMTAIGICCFVFLVYALFGDLSFLKLENLLQWIRDICSDDTIFWIMPFVSLTLLVLSCFLSCKLYLKGGEHYEK